MNKILETVQSVTGLTINEINFMNLDSEREFVKHKTGKNLIFSSLTNKKSNHIGNSGNILLNQNRITTIDEIDKRLEQITYKNKKTKK